METRRPSQAARVTWTATAIATLMCSACGGSLFVRPDQPAATVELALPHPAPTDPGEGYFDEAWADGDGLPRGELASMRIGPGPHRWTVRTKTWHASSYSQVNEGTPYITAMTPNSSNWVSPFGSGMTPRTASYQELKTVCEAGLTVNAQAGRDYRLRYEFDGDGACALRCEERVGGEMVPCTR